MWHLRQLSLWFIYFSSGLLSVLGNTDVTNALPMTKLERQSFLDDHTCLTQDLSISEGVRDLSRCAYMCMIDDSCETVFFNKEEGKCNGCTARYTVTNTPSPSPGFIHFQKVNVGLQEQVQTSCEIGWTGFKGSCYMLSDGSDFAIGALYCEGLGAHPVFIETSDENEFLKTFLAAETVQTAWYIGMTDREVHGVWKYYNTDTVAQFLGFYDTQPDDNTVLNHKHCVVIFSFYDYQWGDHYCHQKFPTVCEMETAS